MTTANPSISCGSDENIQAGAVMAIEILRSYVQNESDPAKATLSEHLNHESALL